ncbi:hypothetical protein ONZ45_g18507 [Pleurotus djamor]|nr:hypothetical protein ONZ45_g18507 [Pleurotus djamor]
MADVAAAPPVDAMQGVVPATDAAADPQPPAVPEEPEVRSETLYLQNLNEKIKVNVLKTSIRGLFKSYGEVLDVVAHSNLRMRGQAFVSFPSSDIAAKAMKEVRGFPLYGKPMQISFARTRSDAVVKKLDPEQYDVHKAQRDEHKKQTRYSNPLKQKFRAKRQAAEKNVTKDQLMGLFAQYPSLYEVRLIPTKKDIAFVEYMDENSAGVAKDALHNYKLDGENKIKITFARK